MAARRRGRARRRSVPGDAELFAVLAALAIGGYVTWLAVHWLLGHWWILVVTGVLAAGGGLWAFEQRRQGQAWARLHQGQLRVQLSQLDAMRHDRFEYAIRDLMRRDGAEAERTGGGGDLGCDVLATDPFGRRWVLQAKHRRDGLAGSPVGTPDLQRLNGTARPVHRADIVVAVTNGRFSSKALPFAKDQRIHLIDRGLLAQWAAGPQPLWELLDKLPPPRRLAG
ncbi:restriction system protein [Streptacidiphilus sp. MAP12-33]|uniref:restriction endonuclease n=1 Tax=Streptacidiphilus sp. MAP12-33 TaxID=3156266 RepID=UPI0035134F06